MRNCWTEAMENFLLRSDIEHILFRHTRKNEVSWSSPLWVRKLIGWGVIAPCLIVINVAIFSLSGRWLHCMWEEEGRFYEYIPLTKYGIRKLPSFSFEGRVKDTGMSLNKTR